MFKHEATKLCIKQYGLLLAVILIAVEIIFMNFAYAERHFDNENTREYFKQYIASVSGKITSAKEEYIEAENDRINSAIITQERLMSDVINGTITDESKYISEISDIQPLLDQAPAFSLVLEKYDHAKDDPDNRYIVGGEYSGFTNDFPDIFFTAFVIVITALVFMNEESSNMIVYIRILPGGKGHTLSSKIALLVSFTFFLHLIISCIEILFFCREDGFEVLSYPLQSIPYFSGCSYDISVIDCFALVKLLRLLGYMFIEAMVILISVTLRRALYAVFIPCALCLIQQFIFVESSAAYYLPTGLLRAVGYFRGDSYEKRNIGFVNEENVKIFSQISSDTVIVIVLVSLMFCVASCVIATRYYCSRKSFRFAALIIPIIFLCGCESPSDTQICYNLSDGFYMIRQNDEMYFLNSEGITVRSFSDEAEAELLRDPFQSDLRITHIACAGDKLYYLNMGESTEIVEVSVSDLTSKAVFSQKPQAEYSFLGLSFSDNMILESDIHSFFSDGKDLYIVAHSGDIYRVKNKTAECIIADGNQFNMLAFDGRMIYYINRSFELIAYDTINDTSSKLAGNFVRALYYDGNRLLYSNSSGIYSFDPNTHNSSMLSERKAEKISSDGENIVFYYDETLYRLNEPEKVIFQKQLLHFSVIAGSNKIYCVYYQDGKTYGDYIDLTIL